jgi:hypothetical protein
MMGLLLLLPVFLLTPLVWRPETTPSPRVSPSEYPWVVVSNNGREQIPGLFPSAVKVIFWLIVRLGASSLN